MKCQHICKTDEEESLSVDDGLRCQICGKVFTQAKFVQQHQVVHSVERKFECETCGKKFSTER